MHFLYKTKQKAIFHKILALSNDRNCGAASVGEMKNKNLVLSDELIKVELPQGVKLRLIQAPMRLNFSLWRPNP